MASLYIIALRMGTMTHTLNSASVHVINHTPTFQQEHSPCSSVIILYIILYILMT